jgi:hypothetical protein
VGKTLFPNNVYYFLKVKNIVTGMTLRKANLGVLMDKGG